MCACVRANQGHTSAVGGVLHILRMKQGSSEEGLHASVGGVIGAGGGASNRFVLWALEEDGGGAQCLTQPWYICGSSSPHTLRSQGG